MAMNTIYLNSNDPTALKIAAVAFPSYKGRKFRVETHDGKYPMNLESHWGGGSRDSYVILRLSDMTAVEIPTNGNSFVPKLPADLPSLPAPDYAVIEHSIFLGKDSGITIHLHTANATLLLPPVQELTWAEKVVLSATGLKSTYAGISNYRFHESRRETGITLEEYEAAKASLISRKLLNAAGAITSEGRNANGRTRLESLKRNA